MARVSVIIPNYNHGEFLERRIQSVLNQTYQDFEVILLDDASTDNSIGVIEKFRNNPKFKIILNDKNSGSVFKQWRLGIEKADGMYIWIAESDDEASPRLLETLVRELDRSECVVLAYCQSLAIDSEGNILHSFADDLDTERWKTDFINDGHDECKYYLVVKNTIPNASAVVFRKETFLRTYIATDMKLCGDWLTWCRILLEGEVYFCADALNYFRQHGGTVRAASSSKVIGEEYLTATRYILSNVRINAEDKRLISYKLLIFWCVFLRDEKLSHIIPYLITLFSFSPINAGRLLIFISLCGLTPMLSKVYRKIEKVPDLLYKNWASRKN